MQAALSHMHSWKLDHKTEDIRGWPVRDESGTLIGKVDDLIIDTESKHVTQLVMEDGKRFQARDVYLNEDSLTLSPSVSTGTAAVEGRDWEPREDELEYEEEAWEPASQRDTLSEAGTEPIGTEPIRTEPIRTEPAKSEERPSKVGKAFEKVKAEVKEAKDDVKEAVQRGKTEEKGALGETKVTQRSGPVTDVADLVVPVVDEEIDVAMRRIETGGVRLESHLVEQPFDQEIRLREEHVSVERRPIDQPLTAADADARLREGSFEVTAKTEIPVVEKRAHVVEEIFLRKEVSEHDERIRDTIRHTDVEVTELPIDPGASPRKGVSL